MKRLTWSLVGILESECNLFTSVSLCTCSSLTCGIVLIWSICRARQMAQPRVSVSHALQVHPVIEIVFVMIWSISIVINDSS